MTDAIAADELREHLAEYGAEPKILVGDGAMLCYNKFEGQLENLSMAPDHLLHQRAGAMAELAASLLAEGKTVSAGELAPVYLRLLPGRAGAASSGRHERRVRVNMKLATWL